MEHSDRRQLDAARQQTARVKARARPWRSIITLVLAAIMAGVSRSARADAASVFFRQTPFGALGRTATEILADLAAMAFCLLAYAATAGLAGRAGEVLAPKIGTAHAALVRYAIVLLGGLATILITLALFGIGLTQLLVGGAFATVLISIAAQQSLSNLFAGIFLVLARPVQVGDRASIRSGPLGGEFCGDVTEIGITYITLNTSDGPEHLPNSQVLAAAVRPGAGGHGADQDVNAPDVTYHGQGHERGGSIHIRAGADQSTSL